MSDGLAVSVAVGLAVGIGFIVLFSLAFNSIQAVAYPHYSITIEGLKDSYAMGESIDFTVKVNGYGDRCGFPQVYVKNADTGETVWNPVAIYLGLCDTDVHDIDVAWTPKNWDGSSFMIDKEGVYTFEAEFEIKVTREFQVKDDVINNDDSQPPEMSLVLYQKDHDDGMAEFYKGKMGSYCWEQWCADTIFIIPEELIEITKGSTIEFQVSDHEQPDQLRVTAYDSPNEHSEQQLTDLANDEYLVDLPSGEYALLVGATWAKGEDSEDAAYYYRIRVS